MSWKGLKVIGIINVIFIILYMILHTIFVLGAILNIDAFKKHYNSAGERDATEILIFWILAMIVYLVLLYFNFGLINQKSRNFLRDWLIAHGILLLLCLGENMWFLNRSGYVASNMMAMVVLIEMIVIVIFCYIIPSSSGSNTGNSANV